MSNWTPNNSKLASAVDAAGFWYDPVQDIIYSRMDPVQRKFGYTYGYDASALLMGMAIDCEPIFFKYGGKTWMIELWKGQYGLMTGCEIGIYNRSPSEDASPVYKLLDQIVGKRPHDSRPGMERWNQMGNFFFDCANNDERLEMSFTLYRRREKLEELFSRGLRSIGG